MSSYYGSMQVYADAQSIYDYVSDAANLPQFVPTVTRADGHEDVVHITGECPHGAYRGVATMVFEPEERRVRWTSRANLNYRGSIHVLPREDCSEVLLTIEFDPGPERSANLDFQHILKEHPPTLQQMVQECLMKIREACEARTPVA